MEHEGKKLEKILHVHSSTILNHFPLVGKFKEDHTTKLEQFGKNNIQNMIRLAPESRRKNMVQFEIESGKMFHYLNIVVILVLSFYIAKVFTLLNLGLSFKKVHVVNRLDKEFYRFSAYQSLCYIEAAEIS